MGIVFNIQRYCLHDGEGIRTNVFLKGCPLRCIWCHNPEGLSRYPVISFDRTKCTLCGACLVSCPARAVFDGRLILERDACTVCSDCVEVCHNRANQLIGKEMSVEEVMDTVVRDKIFYKESGGGMTLSGGEPSMQEDFALELISCAYKEGINVCVETCGAGNRSFFERANAYSVQFLFDIKCIDPSLHKKLTGASNRVILDNLEYLFSCGADIVIRVPLIPGLNDSPEDIRLLCEYLGKNSDSFRYCEIMPYHDLGSTKGERLGDPNGYKAPSATQAHKDRWVALFEEQGISVRVSQ